MDKEIASKLADFVLLVHREILLNLQKELSKGKISYAQFFLLGYLRTQDYLSMTDISKKMSHSTAAATGLVDRLEKLGYVQRFHAADDRRKILVQITRKGIEILKRVQKILSDKVGELEDPEILGFLSTYQN